MSSTYVTVTVAEFRSLYPAFADPEKYSDAALEYFSGSANAG